MSDSVVFHETRCSFINWTGSCQVVNNCLVRQWNSLVESSIIAEGTWFLSDWQCDLLPSHKGCCCSRSMLNVTAIFCYCSLLKGKHWWWLLLALSFYWKKYIWWPPNATVSPSNQCHCTHHILHTIHLQSFHLHDYRYTCLFTTFVVFFCWTAHFIRATNGCILYINGIIPKCWLILAFVCFLLCTKSCW